MAPIDDDPVHSKEERATAVVRRIADALRYPAEAFLDGGMVPGEIDGIHELLRLWTDLPDIYARRRILAQLRVEVNRHVRRSDHAR